MFNLGVGMSARDNLNAWIGNSCLMHYLPRLSLQWEESEIGRRSPQTRTQVRGRRRWLQSTAFRGASINPFVSDEHGSATASVRSRK